MTAQPSTVRELARQVAAAGTDPDHLVAAVAFSVRPRRHPDLLRRRFRDRVPTHHTRAELGDGSCAPVLAALAGSPTSTDLSLAGDVLAAWRGRQVRVALIGDRGYPAPLAEGWPELDPPLWLAWRGQPPSDTPGVAIVGARRATGYGTGAASWLARSVADAGIPVISGGALGIDAAAHEAALDRPGGTTVVLGCGHQIDYPRPHARDGGLFARILEEGGTLISEALPHQPPRAHQIRSRNRIVAGLASAVVVVEGGDRSGALLTAGAAAERGRVVLAVPGDIRAPGSAAPHRLLAEGAAPCWSPSQILEAVDLPENGPDQVTVGDSTGGATAGPRLGQASGGARPASKASDPRAPATGSTHDEASRATASTLPPDVRTRLAAEWPRPIRLERLAREAGLPVAGLLAALTRARIAGEIAEGPDGIRLRRAPVS